MSSDNDFGPWVQHDGKGCPCVGQIVHLVYEGPVVFWNGVSEYTLVSDREVVCIAHGGNSWFWETDANRIIRYRIRRPKGMAILNAILADLPAPTQPMKTDGVIA